MRKNKLQWPLPARIANTAFGAWNEGLMQWTPARHQRAFNHVFSQWVQRQEKRGVVAYDLSGSCKFSSLFVWVLFGGLLRGNARHQFVQGAELIDLNQDAEDVKNMASPHLHDPVFFLNRDHVESLQSCWPRVVSWVTSFVDSERRRLVFLNEVCPQQAMIKPILMSCWVAADRKKKLAFISPLKDAPLQAHHVDVYTGEFPGRLMLTRSPLEPIASEWNWVPLTSTFLWQVIDQLWGLTAEELAQWCVDMQESTEPEFPYFGLTRMDYLAAQNRHDPDDVDVCDGYWVWVERSFDKMVSGLASSV